MRAEFYDNYWYNQMCAGYEKGIFKEEWYIDKAVDFGWIDEKEAQVLHKKYFTKPDDIIIPNPPASIQLYVSTTSVEVRGE